MIDFGNFNLNVPSYFRHKQLGNWKISWNFHEARNKSDAHKPSAFEYFSWKYGSQRDLCSCSWGTLENSSKNLRPEFQRRRTKEKNEIQHFFHLATIPSWNAITVPGFPSFSAWRKGEKFLVKPPRYYVNSSQCVSRGLYKAGRNPKLKRIKVK